MQKTTIYFIGFIAGTVLFTALSPLWLGLLIFAAICGCVAASIFSYNRYLALQYVKKAQEEQRYTDAFIYAEENNLKFAPNEFFYNKKDERRLKRQRNRIKTLFISGIIIALACLALGILVIVTLCK